MRIPNEQRRKGDSKSQLCTFIGYRESLKGYLFLTNRTKRVIKSGDAKFHEGDWLPQGVQKFETLVPQVAETDAVPLKRYQHIAPNDDDGDDDSDEETELKHTMSPIDVSQGDESDTNSNLEESSCSDSESTASSDPLLESAENDVDMSDDEEFRPDPVNSRTKRSTADYKRNYTDQLLLHVETLLATTDDVTFELTPLSLKQALLSNVVNVGCKQ